MLASHKQQLLDIKALWIFENNKKKSFPANNSWEMCFFYGQIQLLEVICLCYVYVNLSVD